MHAKKPVSTDALLLPMKDATRISGLSRSLIYRENEAGRIRYKKLGRSRLQVTESLLAYVNSLPDGPARGGLVQ